MLIQITEQYIEDNHNDLALQNILMFQNNKSFSTETFEDLIAEHLDLYLNNDQFLSINLPIIYRILSKYQQRQRKTKKSTTEIIDFLFVCLSKFGREASCLFSLIDVGDLSSEKVNCLLTDYSEIFDFHFINSSFLKTIYENQCDSMKNKVEIDKLKKESNDEINRLKKELDVQKQKEEENSKVMKNQFEIFLEEINKLKDTQIQTINNNNNEINKLKNQLDEKEKDINQTKTEFTKIREEINKLKDAQLHTDNENNKEINRLKNLLKEKEKEINQTKTQFEKFQKEINNSNKSQLQNLNNYNKEINDLKNQLKEKVCEIFNLKQIISFNFDVKFFNEKNLENQMIIINMLIISQTINNEQINKIKKLLSFLLYINRNSCGIHILSEDEYEKQTNKIDENIDFSKIVINKQITEILFDQNELESSIFLQNIENFTEFYFEIQYPSKKFENIYQKIVDIKNKHIDKVKISIYISGIESTDLHFRNNIEIDHVTFDSSIKEIKSSENEEGSFEGCKSLKNITIPSSITLIGPNAFKNCSSLEKISIPFLKKKLCFSDFKGCQSLTRVIVPPIMKSIPTLNIDDYEIDQLLSNDYNFVFIGTNKQTGKKVVIKEALTNDFPHFVNFYLGSYISQVDLPGILKIQSFRFPLTDEEKTKVNLLKYETKNKKGKTMSFDLTGYIAISEYMTNGNISDNTKKYIESNGKENEKMNPTIRSKIIFGVAATMKQLHKKNIIHRNLTNLNVLLDDKLEPRIGSFSLTRLISDPFQFDDIGSTFSMAPELFSNDKEKCNFPLDVYSYSFFLYTIFSPNIILTKHTKISSKQQYIDAICKGDRPKKVDSIPDHYWKLIERCWDQDPSKRPTFNEITTILKDDKYALEEYGMKTDLEELHRYQNYIDPDI